MKDRFRKWDRGKNNKSRDMVTVLRKLPVMELADDRTEIRFRGMAIPITKLKRYRKMNSSKLRHEFDYLKVLTSFSNDFDTSPASSLSTPRPLRVPEELIKCVRDYIFGAFGKEIWVSVGDLQEIEMKGEKNDALADYEETIYMALDLFDSDHPFDAERTLGRAEIALNSAIRSQNPRLIPKLIASIQYCLRTTNGKFVLLKFKRWASIAIEVFSQHHLLARSINLMYLFLTELENASLLIGIDNVWIATVDCIEFALGPLHYSSLRRRVEYIPKLL